MKSAILLFFFAIGTFADFSSSGQNQIVDAHNRLRSSIAKGTYVAKGTRKESATNMLKMQWDSGVAASAQAYANRCPTGHSGTSGVGENLYWYWTSGSLGDLNRYGADASASWENEFQQYGWKSNLLDLNLFNTGIGHATQMAWAKTNLVGCGVKDCGRDTNGLNKVTVVCQYKPPGNYINQYIYNSGNTCSGCPSGTSCESSTGLCR
uniref:SCP domain-containing protein n=1 Tax=Caenorhabditis japonica TaxID=281687 RepID=A0A8R1HS19_CAEJA